LYYNWDEADLVVSQVVRCMMQCWRNHPYCKIVKPYMRLIFSMVNCMHLQIKAITKYAEMTQAVYGSFNFLKPNVELYKREKAFRLEYEPPHGQERTNIELEEKSNIPIHDLRDGNDIELNFEQSGIAVANLQSNMSETDFYDDELVINRYYDEIRGMLHLVFQPTEVKIMEHQVCIICNNLMDRQLIRKGPKTPSDVSNLYRKRLRVSSAYFNRTYW
jgi:hypothetical protein